MKENELYKAKQEVLRILTEAQTPISVTKLHRLLKGLGYGKSVAETALGLLVRERQARLTKNWELALPKPKESRNKDVDTKG